MATEVKLYPFWGKDRPGASYVWEHYGFKKNTDTDQVNKDFTYCKYCLKAFVYNSSNGTSSLHSHIERKHISTLTNQDNNSPNYMYETKTPGIILENGSPENSKNEEKNCSSENSKEEQTNKTLRRKIQIKQELPSQETEKLYTLKHRNQSSSVSVVWEYFGFKKTAAQELDKSRTHCRICSRILTYNRSTTSMINHLLRVHPEVKIAGFSAKKEHIRNCNALRRKMRIKNKLLQAKDQTIEKPKVILIDSIDDKKTNNTMLYMKDNRFVSTSKSREKQKKVSESIVNFLAQDMMSTSILHGEGFKNMIAALDPEYEINSSQFYQDKIEVVYNSEKSKIQLQIANENCGAITVEIWPSPTKDSHYITVRYHCVTSLWKHLNVTLQTVNIRNNQDSIIADAIQGILSSWSISENLLFAVTSNNPEIKGALSETVIQKEGITCFGDIINHAAISVLNDSQVSDTINNIKEICRNFATNTEVSQLLKDLCHDNFPNVHFPQALPSAQVISWSDMFHVLEDVHKFEKPLKQVFSESAIVVEDFEVLTDDDWKILKEVIQVISPLSQVVDSLCSEQNPTASSIMPIIHQLQILMKPLPTESQKIQKMKNSVLNILESSYQDESVKDILFIATVLDPRFKTLWFLSDNERLCVYKYLTIAAIDVTDMKQENSIEEPLNKVSKLDCQSTNHNTGPVKGLASLFGASATTEPEDQESHFGPEKEVHQYREEKQLAMDGDPFTWWRDREAVFPILSQLAKRYLCIPACSLLPEMLFTKAGDTYKNKRTIVVSHAEKPEQIDYHLLLYHNFN